MTEPARGYVATTLDGRMLLETLGEHRRSVMVNWLVRYGWVLVTERWTDSDIASAWNTASRGRATIVEVEVHPRTST